VRQVERSQHNKQRCQAYFKTLEHEDRIQNFATLAAPRKEKSQCLPNFARSLLVVKVSELFRGIRKSVNYFKFFAVP
jgi:hypothetical protein